MNVNVNDEKLKDDLDFQNFINENPDIGNLKIRTNTAYEAFPIKNVKVVVSKQIGDNNIIFFEGETDESGMINNINLPTPKKVESNEQPPNFVEYNLIVSYEPQDFYKEYKVSMCCDVGIIKYINIVPNPSLERIKLYGD